MQEQHQTDFDLLVRSTLENAEVKPSKRVWEGISARLDESSAAAVGRSTPVWYRWAGVSLAAAACVAAGVLFIRPTNSENELTLTKIDTPMALAEASYEPTLAKAARKEAATYRISSALEALEAEEAVGGQTLESFTAESGSDSAAPVQSGDTAPAQTESRAESRAESSGAMVADAPETASDPFAAMEEEDLKQSIRNSHRRTALYAQGSISGNDSGLARIQSRPSMAPGAGSSGFSELSTSTYGVPFSVGVGARFYFLPKLSLGTGVEYSLLTRTFTGKYTEVDSNGNTTREEAGDVSHKVQYLGVPLNVYYDLFDAKPLKLYIYGGGSAEACVSNKYTMYANPRVSSSDPVEKLQFSVGVGIGLEFSVAKNLAVYIDPSMRYYFPSDQPKSVRTDKPLMVNLDAGIRFVL